MSDKVSMSRPYNLESYRRPSERVRWDRKDKERGRRGGGGGLEECIEKKLCMTTAFDSQIIFFFLVLIITCFFLANPFSFNVAPIGTK